MSAPFVSMLPPLSGAQLPMASPMGLSDDEQMWISGLSSKLTLRSPLMLLQDEYYKSEQRMTNLGISVPPQLAGIRTGMDWPRICVDPIVPGCVIDGFRIPGAHDVDSELQEHWQANDLDAESPLCWLDSLIQGCGYMIVGAPDVPGDSPLVTVESPLNLSTSWDPRTRRILAAYQSYEVEGVFRAVLYLPDQTVSMSRGQMDSWTIDDRDIHNFGQVPVVRFPNRARSGYREGRSEITPAVMNLTDSTCRTLLGMEIAREFYAIPHKYVLGAAEADFVDASGNRKTAMDMAMNKFLAFERDEDDNLPTVGQFTAFDPSVFTKMVDENAQLMASYTGFPPSYFGQTTTANPASADAIRTAENGLVSRRQQAQRQWSAPSRDVMRLVWRFANGGAVLPASLKMLATDWDDASTPTPFATSQAITMQVDNGIVPRESDVVLKRLGYSTAERAQIAIDRVPDEGEGILDAIGNSAVAKAAISTGRLEKLIDPAALLAAQGGPLPTAAPTPPVTPPK